jgi:tRNA (cytidine32/uridine32-2'-O)-methyltransferase
MLANIRIVLVETSHPGNIGAAARAMKNMELNQLYLVNPKIFPHVDATARAAGADDILATAKVTASLYDAIADCSLVIGTSARERAISLPLLDPTECAREALSVKNEQVAILFGRENNGLSNDELNFCHYQVQIPTNPKFASLNIGAAVQLIAYEIYKNCIENKQEHSSDVELATVAEVAEFYQHLEKTIFVIGFLHGKNPEKILNKLHRLFNRAKLEKNEVAILRGILTKTENKLDSQLID